MQYYANAIKLTVFFTIISFGISATMILSTYPILILGMLMGPFTTFLFLRKKGIYNSSILIVFLLETSLVCIGFYSHFPLAIFIGNVALGIAITSSMIMCPIATFYLRGPASFLSVFPKVTIGYFLGFLLANPIYNFPIDAINSTRFILQIIALILIAFFTFFSAWKGRFILLK